MGIIIRTPEGIDPARLAAPLRQAVYAIDPDMPVSNVRTLAQIVRQSVDQPRLLAVLSAGFAGLALVLSAVGLYGLMAYVVALRTREIGVRIALGATRSQVFRLVLGDGLGLAGAGAVLGLGGAVLAGRAMDSLLFEVRPGDPLILLWTAGLLLGVAAVACLVPARRATRVDPLDALRAQ
jgi:ABC-type antimicrobial peptide transport system permease subunit